MGLRFRVLGPVEIDGGTDGVTVPIGGLKQRILLVTLLLNANRPVSHERLSEAMWGAVPPPSATANLHTYAARLRQSLGATGSGAKRLVTRPGQYLLLVEPGELDLHRFEDLAERARAALARGEFLSVAQVAGQALALWRGPAADRVPRVPVLAPQLEALDEQRLSLLEDRIEARLALGEHAAVVTRLRELVAEHPLRERAWAQLMLALYRGGDVAASLAAFQNARAALKHQLGIEPGAELTELQQGILKRDPSLGATTPESRTMDPGRPRHDAAGSNEPPRQLPRDPALVGRLLERRTLLELVTDGGRGLVVAIHGPGGVGKSALAIHAAHLLAQRFPDGQLYVDLGGARAGLPAVDAAAALARVLRALGVPSGEVPRGIQEAAARFRSMLARRQILMVVDNAVDAAQVQPLLPAGSGCATIVTSRRLLPTLGGATHLGLDALSAPEAVDLLGQVVGAARVAAEPDAAEEVARLCDHLPLALQIAGARLAGRPHLRIAQLAARLADERVRLEELEAGELSVRFCLRASYRPLRDSADPADRLAGRVFRLVGLLGVPDVSVPGVAGLLEVAEAVAAEALDRLVDAQLLTVTAQGRYRIRGLPLRFAAEQAAHQAPASPQASPPAVRAPDANGAVGDSLPERRHPGGASASGDRRTVSSARPVGQQMPPP